MRNRSSSAEWPRCPNRVGACLRRSRPGDGIPCASGKTSCRAAHGNSGGADGGGGRAIRTWSGNDFHRHLRVRRSALLARGSRAVQRLFKAVATSLGVSMLMLSPTCNRFSSFHCKESIGAQGISAMRDPQLTAELAAHANTTIPDATRGTGKMLDDYKRSKLAKFHEWFYSQEQHPAELWPETYDRQPLEILPACARVALEMPNDLLLRPAFIRRLVRVMLALGWHPRHIAGLICSKYQRDFGWTQLVNVDRGHARRFLHARFRRPFRSRHGRSGRFQLRFGSGARHVHIVKLRIQSAEF